MTRNVYVIWDRVSADLVGINMYALMCFRTHQEAVRYFADAINDPSSILNKHPGDYELRAIGFVTPDGNIHQQPSETIITGDVLLAAQQQDKE